MEIMHFSSKTQAEWYRRGCGLKGTSIRMLHKPDHKWANRRGNVAAIWCGHDCGGDKFLFSDGYVRYRIMEGMSND